MEKDVVMILDGCKYEWEYLDEYSITEEIPIPEDAYEEWKREMEYEGEDVSELKPFDLEYTTGTICINREHKISLVFARHRMEDEDEDDLESDTDIVNVTVDYDDLIEYINTHTNFTIYWTQVYGTSADYTIIEDYYIDNAEGWYIAADIDEKLSTCKKEENATSYKYTILHNGTLSRFLG